MSSLPELAQEAKRFLISESLVSREVDVSYGRSLLLNLRRSGQDGDRFVRMWTSGPEGAVVDMSVTQFQALCAAVSGIAAELDGDRSATEGV